MADVTGGPVVTNASPFAVPADLTALKDHFGGQSAFSVALIADLPASNNWAGRTLFVVEDTSVRVWTGSEWLRSGTDAWTAYTPLLTNLNVGSGGLAANDCEWRYEGDLVRVRFRFTLGTGASVTGIPKFALPVTAAALQHPAAQYAGAASLYDFTATVGYSALVGAEPGSTSLARVILAGGSNGVYAPINATTPFSWAGDGDTMAGEFTYKPA